MAKVSKSLNRPGGGGRGAGGVNYFKKVSTTVKRNVVPAKKVKVSGTKMTTGPSSNVKKITKEQSDAGKWSMNSGIGKYARKTTKKK